MTNHHKDQENLVDFLQKIVYTMLANTIPPPLHKVNNTVSACMPIILSVRGEGNSGQFAALAMGKCVEGNRRQVAGVCGKGNGRQIAALERATVGKLLACAARAKASNSPCW